MKRMKGDSLEPKRPYKVREKVTSGGTANTKGMSAKSGQLGSKEYSSL